MQPRERSISPTKRSLLHLYSPKSPEPREHNDSLDRLEKQVQILGDIHFHEIQIEKALKDYITALHELSETELKLALEMKKLQPYAQFNIWGNLFFEVGECHRELQALKTDACEQIEGKVLQSLKTPRNSGERQRVRKRLAQQVKKFRELSAKRALSAHHKDVTSQELVASLRHEAVELQLQRDALNYVTVYNGHQHHALLSNIAQTIAFAHRYHERSCVRLLELQPMWRELQGANFGPPSEDIIVWIAQNVPEEPPSLTRSLSQRLLGSPRHRLLLRKSPTASPNGSPRDIKLSPRQLEKQPAPPVPPAGVAKTPVMDSSVSALPVTEPIDASASLQAQASQALPHPAVARIAAGPPSSSSPRSSSSVSRSALQRRVADLENALRDVRTAIEKLQSTAQNEELRGSLHNILLLAAVPSPRSAATAGLPINFALSQSSSVRSSITVPATASRSSRSAKRLSMDPTDPNQLLQLLASLPPNISQTPTYHRLLQLIPDFKPAATPLSPSTSQRQSGTAVPSAPSTALQLHKLKTVPDEISPRRATAPHSHASANPLKDALIQLLLEMKRESESAPAPQMDGVHKQQQ